MSKKTADPTIDFAPVLGDTEVLFPPSADPVPGVAGAAVHMKVPTFWPDAAEVCYHRVAVLPQ